MTWPDRAVARITEGQEGQVSHEQLVELGVAPSLIEHSLRRGRLYETFGRIYGVGDRALPELWRESGAARACGEGSFVSRHWSAALWGFRPPAQGDVEVTVPYGRNARRKGIRIHRARRIDPRDVTVYRNIPVSTPAFTLLEIATDLTYVEFERAFDDALTIPVMRMAEAEDVLRRHAGKRGIARFAEFARPEHGDEITWSWAEQKMKSLARKGGLPMPSLNHRRGRIVPDFLWRPERVIVEVDGFRWHGARRAFESDRARDAALAAKGWIVIRVTWRQLKYQPELVLVRIAQTLALRCQGSSSNLIVS
jgi:very-short-patch-repair endonuclease